MLQVRLREGSDKRWFNPNRDIVSLLPMMIKKSLMAFDEFEGIELCTKEQALELADKLGKLVVHIIQDKVHYDDAEKALIEIENNNPAAFKVVAIRMLHVMISAYTAFIADAKPKAATDAELPTIGLEEIADQIARSAAKRGS